MLRTYTALSRNTCVFAWDTLKLAFVVFCLAVPCASLGQGAASDDSATSEETAGQVAGASGVGASTLLVTSTQCYQTGCSVEDAVLAYNGTTGSYIGPLIPSVNDPWGLAIHPVRESLLVLSRSDSTVREYDANTGAFVRVLVKPGAEGLHAAQGMALSPTGRLFVASNQVSGQLDKFNGILEFDSTTGAFIAECVDGGSSLSETCSNPICLRGPNAMLVAPANNHIYVASSINDSVQEYLLDGTYLGVFLSAKLIGPGGLIIRPPGTTNAGNLLVSSRWINPSSDFDDSVLEFNGTTRGLVPTNGGVFGNSSLIRPGPLAWGADGNLLIGERAGEIPPFFADRVGKRNGTTGASMTQFTPVGDSNTHQLSALLLTHVNFATDDADFDGDTDLKDLASFQNCFPSSTSSQCLTPFDDNKTSTVGRWDFLAFLGNFHGPRRPCTGAAQCNDGDVCTTDQCVSGFCAYTAAANGTSCADSLFCNGPEACSAGVCRGRSTCVDSAHCNEATDTCRQCLTNSECDDGNPCTDDSCSSFTCQHVAHTRTCDDGSPCTTNDRCSAGACVGGPPPNCNDNNICTTDSCDTVLGCIHTDNLLPCDDGNACSIQDFCLQGTCRPGRENNCNDGNVCTNDTCNPNTGCVYQNNSGTCDDGDPCTDNDVCSMGVCDGAPKNCADTVACTVDRCVSGVCQNLPENSRCTNGNWCDGTETCDAVLGCAPGTPPCNDDIPCTVDTCDPDAQTCSYTPEHAACGDGLFCNGDEQCSPTLGCQPGTPPDCLDDVACTDDSCDEQNDACVNEPNPVHCEDNDVCTDDICNASGCSHPFNTAPCNDGLLCTINDTCAGGSCAGTPVACPEGEQCDPADGQCKQCLNNGQCNDNNPCTDDACNAGACAYTDNTASCDDGLFCTLTDVCSGGDCAGSGDRCPGQLCNETTDACVQCLTAADCQDNNGCTDNVCNNGTCQFPPNTAPCGDGLFCNGDEVCGGGSCQPGTPPSCDDGLACTIDTCNEATDGCDHAPNDGACNDGLFCNGVEACSTTLGCVAGTSPDCADSIPCTVDVCNETTDSCDHTPDNDACDDGLFCNGSETCSVTLGCQAGTPPDCSSLSGQCTNGVCDEGADSCVAQPKPVNTACDDGLFCTVSDACDASGVCAVSSARDCSAQNGQCTNGVCDEGADSCVAQPKPVNTACDDGLFCTVSDSCDAGGSCSVSTPRDCSAQNSQCTNGVCDDGADSCVAQPKPINTACDDGLFCTVSDACNASGVCAISSARDCSAQNGQCTDGVCDENADTCVAQPKPVNTACDDGLFCTVSDSCDASGSCIVNTPRDCSAQNGQCADGVCDENADTCVAQPKPVNTACDDGLFCTVSDSCDAGGSCSVSTPRDCSAQNGQCTDGVCDEGGDSCVAQPKPVNTPCDDGLFCTVSDACDVSGTCSITTPRDCSAQNGQCTNGVCDEGADSCVAQPKPDNTACDDSLFCTVTDKCISGACTGGVARDCTNLDTQCADGVCDEGQDACVAQNVPDGTGCDDGLFCTLTDQCASGNCAGSGDRCTVSPNLLCNETSDACEECATNADCDDDNVCTDDTCVNGTCMQFTNSSTCDDSLFCTIDDHCLGGQCVGGAGDRCTTAPDLFCDENADVCVECLSAAECGDDGNACTDTICDNGVCDDVNNTASCDDGNFCTSTDTCSNGSCAGSGDPCSGQLCDENANVCVECLANGDCTPDSNPCTDTICDNGTCVEVNNAASCNDGDFCTATDACSNGVCIGSGDPCPGQLCDENADACADCLSVGDCTNDSNPCTDLDCVNGSCEFSNNTVACDDSLDCTVNDQCLNGSCSGDAPDCDDNIACTTDACAEPGGCTHSPDDGACDDNLFCNGVEACDTQAGCVMGADPCVASPFCNETTDACADCLVDGDCDDGLFCTGLETCVGGVCNPGADPCPAQACDEVNDQCGP